MLKKIFLIPAIFLLTITPAFASTVEEAIHRLTPLLLIETEVDQSILIGYADRFFVGGEFKAAMAGAVTAKLFCPTNRLLRPKSTELSPVINGIISFTIRNNGFETVKLTKEGSTVIQDNALFIIDDKLSDEPPDDFTDCYAVVNRNNKAFVVFRDAKTTVNYMYQGKVFYRDGQTVILTEAKKYINGTWQSFSSAKYTAVLLGENVSVMLNGNALTQNEINGMHLDRMAYFIGSIDSAKSTAFQSNATAVCFEIFPN